FLPARAARGDGGKRGWARRYPTQNRRDVAIRLWVRTAAMLRPRVMLSPGSVHRVRFGDFELDLAAYALRRDGQAIKLGRQPMDLLILLVERPRQLVARQDIIDRLWGKEVFVDVETGINTAISKVRQALGDAADAPVYVETVPGRGYRFIADVVPV